MSSLEQPSAYLPRNIPPELWDKYLETFGTGQDLTGLAAAPTPETEDIESIPGLEIDAKPKGDKGPRIPGVLRAVVKEEPVSTSPFGPESQKSKPVELHLIAAGIREKDEISAIPVIVKNGRALPVDGGPEIPIEPAGAGSTKVSVEAYYYPRMRRPWLEVIHLPED